jgi:DNA-directed RNA polymerase subunit RPC12/RpoP
VRGPELHYYRCGRVCKSVTVKSVYTGRYERCRACGSMALFQFTIPVETDKHRALHAQGIVLNPDQPPQPPQICVRCGLDFTGKQLPRWRADGKVCRECYFAEDSPEVAAATEEQSVNQSTERS